jgi:EF-P beta-lysylation protein EpmB
VRTAIRDGGELCRRLELPADYQEAAVRASRQFPVFAPRGFVAKMRRGDPQDPLLRQVLPLHEEGREAAGFTTDPVADLSSRESPGLLQKYSGRALMITTGACAIHCRYCFRRHFPYQEAPQGIEQWRAALEQLSADPTIDEIILSGGDPLMLVDQQLRRLVEQLALIPHLRRLRVHTRLPVVIPERVTDELVALLRENRLAPFVVIHANHPRELDESVNAALSLFADAGIPLLNQAVLLRGVNDQAATLVALCRRLLDARVLPYYLHQLDRVAGAAHFAVPVEQGREIMRQLRISLPGYAIPRYVQEVVGAAFKQPIEFAL